MPMTADQFAKAVIATGLSSVEEIKAFWSTLPAGKRPKDGETFATALIESKKLTKFQASEILAGSKTPLLIGDYVLLGKIGAGGMGQVFKAQHRHMKRQVAIKLLPEALTKDDAAVKRFQREVEAAAKLVHPNIVQAYDASVQKGVWYLVMECVEGRDLAGVVAHEGPLPVARAVDYIRQTARGLGYAHENGVVHRDIKPANLLLDKRGTIKILDMGLARFDDGIAAQEGLTQSGQVMGTVDYMAPEQAFDVRSADARADIYSLGCTLYRLLTGQNLYDGESIVQKLMAHQSKPIPSLVNGLASGGRQPPGDFLSQLDPIFQKLVAKLPEDRFQTMAAVEAALAPFAPAASGSSIGNSTGGGSAGGASSPSGNEQTSAFAAPAGIQLLSSPSAAVDGYSPTVSLANSQQSTDPVSERSIQFARQNTPQPARAKRPPWWRQPVALIAAGLAAVLLVALGIWVIVRDKEGKEVARIKVPDGGNVTVQAGDGASAPVKSVPLNPEAHSSASGTNYAMVLDGSGYAEVENFVHDRQQPITIEAWANLKPTRVVRPFIALPGDDYRIKIQQGAMAGSNLLQFGASLGNNSPPDFMYVNSEGPPPAEWFHVALCVHGADRFDAFVDGKPIKEQPRLLNNLLMQRSNVLMIGNDRDPNAKSIDGLIDELRVSKSIRYVEPFAPERRFEPDADTVALYHFDEGQGDVLVDSSGNNHHGKIVGAKWVNSKANVAVALEFTSDAQVNLPALPLADLGELCVEAWVTPQQVEANQPASIFNAQKQASLKFNPAGSWTVVFSNARGQWHVVDSKQKRVNGRLTHVAGTLSPEGVQMYVDGKRVVDNPVADFRVSTNNLPGVISEGWEGTIHELRISKVRRYEQDFSPTRGFATDADTLALYHFDEGQGDVLRDSSGNNHHGKIVGAKWVQEDGTAAPIVAATQTDSAPQADAAPRWPLAPSRPEDIRKLLDFSPTAKVTVLTAGPLGSAPISKTLTARDSLPTVPATIIRVHLDGEPNKANDALLGFLATLTDLEDLNFGGHAHAVTPAGLQKLAALTNLRRLDLLAIGDSARGKSELLKSWPHLEYLRIPSGRITSDEWAAAAAKRPSITDVSSYRADLADTGLSHLEKMPQLKTLDLVDSYSITQAAIDRFAAAVPGCRITSGPHGKPIILEPRTSVNGPASTNESSKTPSPAVAPFDAAQARAHQAAWAKYLGVPVEYTNSIGMKFALIPPGEFTMGREPAASEEMVLAAKEYDVLRENINSSSVQHPVVLTRPFYVGMYEVRQRDYLAVMGDNPSALASTGAKKEDVVNIDTSDHPVDSVSWLQAEDFCAKLTKQEGMGSPATLAGQGMNSSSGLGYRLPTEAEWEYACRAGTTTSYWNGPLASELANVAWMGANSAWRLHAVGEKEANPFGLCDMHGNACEWVQDWWDPAYYQQFQDQPATDPVGPLKRGVERVIRGGHVRNKEPFCSSWHRSPLKPSVRQFYNGFRVVLEVEAVRHAKSKLEADSAPRDNK